MKKFIALLLAALMLIGVLQVTAVSVFASTITQEDLDDAPVPEGWTLPGDADVSGYKPFSYQCDYCGETHEGFFGIFITLLHLLLSAFNLGQKAVTK